MIGIGNDNMCRLYTQVFGRQTENSEIAQVNLDRIQDSGLKADIRVEGFRA